MKTKIIARIRPCCCKNKNSEYELEIKDKRGFFRFKEHISLQDYHELSKNKNYDLLLARRSESYPTRRGTSSASGTPQARLKGEKRMNKLEKKQTRERKRSIALSIALFALFMFPCTVLFTGCGGIGDLFGGEPKVATIVEIKGQYKTAYTVGETLDVKGMKLDVIMDDEDATEKTLDVKKGWVTSTAMDQNYKFTTTGEATLKITINKKTISVTVTVTAKPVA